MIVIPLTTGYTLAPALFLNLDNTVRRSITGASFIKDIHDLALVPGIEEIIYRYKNIGYLIVGITNAGGVAHGFKTFDQVKEENFFMLDLFDKNPFDMVSSSPHKENGTVEPWCHRSFMRIPAVGQLVNAEIGLFNSGYVIDWRNSLIVGTHSEDEELARNANVNFMPTELFLKPHAITFHIPGSDFKEKGIRITDVHGSEDYPIQMRFSNKESDLQKEVEDLRKIQAYNEQKIKDLLEQLNMATK